MAIQATASQPENLGKIINERDKKIDFQCRQSSFSLEEDVIQDLHSERSQFLYPKLHKTDYLLGVNATDDFKLKLVLI